MSGIGFWELFLVFIIGLLILGPERLPRVASQIGRWVGRARRTANQLRYQLEREIALADIEKSTRSKKETDQAAAAEEAAKPAAGDEPAAAADTEGDSSTGTGTADAVAVESKPAEPPAAESDAADSPETERNQV